MTRAMLSGVKPLTGWRKICARVIGMGIAA